MKALAAMTFGLVMFACAETAPTTIPTPIPTPTQIGRLTFTDTTCTFEPAVTTIGPGLISLAVFNQTQGVVFMIMSRVADGHTFEEIDADVRNAKKLAEAGVVLEGRPSYMLGWAPLGIGPGGSTTVNETAVAGIHAIICARRYENNGQTAPYGLVGPIEVR